MSFLTDLFCKYTGFRNTEDIPGCIPTIDPNGAQHDLIFGAVDTTQTFPPTVSWLSGFPTRHLQNGAPFCVSYSSTHLREWYAQKDGNYQRLSPDYIALESHTSSQGNAVSIVLDTEKKYGIPLADDFSYDPHAFDPAQAPYPVPPLSNEAQVRGEPYKWTGYAWLRPNSPQELKSALQKGPIGITLGLDTSTFVFRKEGQILPTPAKPPNVYHAVVCSGYNDFGWEIYDSLAVSHYILPYDYEIQSAYAVVDLPPDWKTIQAKVINDLYPNNTARYGKVRDYPAEVRAASLLLDALHHFHNQSVLEAAGRFWTILVNCIVYGGYSLTDCCNCLYAWRRTGKFPLDFNLPRK